jgi:hypothetical protein
MKIFTWTKRLVITLSFLALVATNVLTLSMVTNPIAMVVAPVS